jgi:hypothetical protein
MAAGLQLLDHVASCVNFMHGSVGGDVQDEHADHLVGSLSLAVVKCPGQHAAIELVLQFAHISAHGGSALQSA